MLLENNESFEGLAVSKAQNGWIISIRSTDESGNVFEQAYIAASAQMVGRYVVAAILGRSLAEIAIKVEGLAE